MTALTKIDSNVTGLRYAEEASYKTLAGTEIWFPLEPNTYDDFGGSITTVARNPINDSRQRKKGVVTDLDASGGFNTDLTQVNLQDILQGFFFADLRPKGEEIVTAVVLDGANPDEYQVASTTGFQVNDLIEGQNFTNAENNTVNKITVIVADTSIEVADGLLADEASPPSDARVVVVGHEAATADIDVVVSGALPVLFSNGGVDWTTLGLLPGEWIFVGGDVGTDQFANTENNGFKRIRSITATDLELDKSDITMIAETGSGIDLKIFLGRVLKNELGTEIIRRTYSLERSLGVPDDAAPTEVQYEFIDGAVPSEMTINIPTADKLMVDLSFVGADNAFVTATSGDPRPNGGRPAIVEADAFNTSSDFTRINLSQVVSGDEAPTPLFAFAQEITVTLNNNVTPNKAVSVLGAFEVTAGTFEIGGSITAYFADVAALSAIRNNADITMDFAIAKDNAGIVVDIPLITLGDGRPNVEQDEPITLPLTMEAATAALIDGDLNYTLQMVFFDYLPNAAE